jgi:hypothetical protein
MYHLMREEDVPLCGARDGLLTFREELADCPRCWQRESIALRARVEELRSALLDVSTDLAQDRLEDPMGNAEREAGGFYRLSVATWRRARVAIPSWSCPTCHKAYPTKYASECCPCWGDK